MDRLLTVRGVAEVLSVSKTTAHRLINDGEIEAVWVSSRLKVRQSVLQAFIRKLPAAKPVEIAGDNLEYALDHKERTGKFPAFKLNAPAS